MGTCSNGSKRYIFFDRDGTINLDKGYSHKLENLVFIDGVISFMRHCQEFYDYIIVTNQAGIAKKKFSLDQMHYFNSGMCSELEALGISIKGLYFCPHHPEAVIKSLRVNCGCRKPNPGLFEMAAEDFKINKSQSLIVGDKLTDIKAAYNFGLRKGFLISRCEKERLNLIEFNKSQNCSFIGVSNFAGIKLKEKLNERFVCEGLY